MAIDISLNKKWAIKRISCDFNDSSSKNLSNEANIMKGLNHPVLPSVVDVFKYEKSVFIVMDYIEGVSLEDLIKRNKIISEQKVLSIINNISDALIYLHSKNPPIIHRDIKPANIIITKEGSVKLIDFGIAREYKENNYRDTSYMGTKGYAAPEQFLGIGQTDERSDIYSLGVTAYRALTGKDLSIPPFKMDSIKKYNKKITKKTEKIILKCAEDDPNKRFQNAFELKNAINNKKNGNLDKYNKKYKIALFLIIFFILIYVQSFKNYSNVSANGYEELESIIEEYKSDELFSIDEEEELIGKLGNTSDSTNKEQYGLLMYKVGLLYWYYFSLDNNNNVTTGVIYSKNYFDKATEYLNHDKKEYDYASLYLYLSEFLYNSKVDMNEITNNDYNNLLDCLKEYINIVKEEDEYVKYRSIIIIGTIINRSINFIKNSDVKKDELLSFLEEIKTILNIVLQDHEKNLEIITSFDYTEKNIKSIYKEEFYEY